VKGDRDKENIGVTHPDPASAIPSSTVAVAPTDATVLLDEPPQEIAIGRFAERAWHDDRPDGPIPDDDCHHSGLHDPLADAEPPDASLSTQVPSGPPEGEQPGEDDLGAPRGIDGAGESGTAGRLALLDAVNLTTLTNLTDGRPDLVIGLLDGPVASGHPDLEGAHIRALHGDLPGTCNDAADAACSHGTFVAGILVARRESAAPALCPDCTLLVRPIFGEPGPGSGGLPSATADDLADAIVECVEAGVRVVNLSAALLHSSVRSDRRLEVALDFALQREVIVVAAAGNQGGIDGSVLTRHRWVVPVVATDLSGRPIGPSTLGRSIGLGGLGAPGDSVTSLGVDGRPLTWGGASVAAPFVTGAVALLWSLFPEASAAEVRLALRAGRAGWRPALVPPLLDGLAAYRSLEGARGKEDRT
jgi:subtilisin family serine protease